MISISLIIVSLLLVEISYAQLPQTQSLENIESAALNSKTTELTKTETIEQIMSKSGMNQMIEQLPDMAAMGFDQQAPPPINRRRYEQFRNTYLQAFSPSMIRDTVTAYLNNHYQAKRFTELRVMLKTPLIEKMTELEIQSSTVESQQQMMQSANTIMGQVAPERLVLIQQLDKAQQATQSMLEMQMTMIQTMMVNVNKIVPSEQQLSEVKMNDLLENIRKQSIYPAQQHIYLNMVYAYRTATDSELKSYIALYESSLGRWSTELIKQAWVNVSEAISSELATLMTQNFVKENAL